MNAEDAQYLQTRKFQISEIARIFRVPPHLIGDLEKATFSNIEQQSLDYVQYSLMPWLVRWEQAMNDQLSGDPAYTFKFNTMALLRGDQKSRYESYAIGKNWGFLSTNDIRALEDLNPIEGGDIYLSPLNMIPVDQIGQQSGDKTNAL